MIIIHPLKIAYQNVPKIGTTSLFNWFYEILSENSSENKPENVRGWIKEQQNEIIENQSLENFNCPKDYLIFCLIRDPVKRLLSAYSNRVLHHNELGFSHKQGQKKAIKSGLLAARPTLNYFVEHLEDYQSIAPSIRLHTRPMVHFLGKDSSIYNYIFDISDMESLRQVLLDHWCNNKVLENQVIPKIPHLQRGGKKFSLSDLTESNFNKCLEFYADDYATFSTLNKDKPNLVWQQTSEKKTGCISKAVVKIQPCMQIVEAHFFNKIQFTVCDGELESFSGIVTLKSTVKVNYQLVANDTRGRWRLKWKQYSPKMAQKYPDNPHAQNSFFNAQGLKINADHPIRIFLEDKVGKRHLLFIITEGDE